MSFGISGASIRSQMVLGDVVVAFYDRSEQKFRAEDYYISHLAQCDGKQGVCPDERIGAKNDAIISEKWRLFKMKKLQIQSYSMRFIEFVSVSFPVEGDRKNGVTSVKYRRLLQTNDPVNDQAIPLDRDVYVIAAIGPLNERREANSHSHSSDSHTTENVQMNFNAENDNTCTTSLYDIKETSKVKAWPTRVLRNQNNITVRIGPTGGERGYTRITGEKVKRRVNRAH